MKMILVGSKFALVDDEDYDRLSKVCWILVHGYAVRREGGRYNMHTRYMHRDVLGLPVKDNKRDYADHINGNRLDNRRENLRVVTKAGNSAWRGLRTDNKSGFKGVFWCYNRWMAQITIKGKSVYLGRFEDPVKAASAYDKAAIQHFGECALTNARLAECGIGPDWKHVEPV